MKFRFLKVDLEKKTTYNCHAAQSHPINLNWISNNPGQLFNTDINVAERKMMLDNKRNPSCEQNCWPAEDVGAISPRLFQKGNIKTHFDPITQPEIIDLTIGSDCNLTCSYCCKEYSSRWRKDILDNGDYAITDGDDRYKKSQIDVVLQKTSQNKKKDSIQYQLFNQEIYAVKSTLKRLVITGGEPFLDNGLLDIINTASETPLVSIYSGLGVSLSRFEQLIKKIAEYPNVELIISAENIGKFLEFNRYGVKWEEFDLKIELIKSAGIPFKFQCTLTNLTLFGFSEFYKHYKDIKMDVSYAYQPTSMAPYVLDHQSKQYILEQLKEMPDIENIRASMEQTPSDMQKLNIKEFLTEFTQRRKDIDISMFPSNFLNWINYVV